MLAVTVAALVWRHKTKPYHLLVVKPGVLYRSGQLSPDVLEAQIQRFGIRTVVNLQAAGTHHSPRYRAETEACRRSGATLIDIPLEAETPPTSGQQSQWLELLRDPRKHPILVHCQHGIVRTGMFVAMYEIEMLGRDNQAVLYSLPMFGHRLDRPKRKPMRDFILKYQPKLGYQSKQSPGSGRR